MSKVADAEREHWSHMEESGVYWGMRFLFLVYRVLGERIFSFFLFPVILYFFTFNRQARQASLQFLNRAYAWDPEHAPFYRRPGLKESIRHFMHFGQSILDKLKSWMGLIKRSELLFDNRPEFTEAVNSGKGGIIVTSHLGNVEICRAIASGVDEFTLNVLVHTKHAENFNRLMQSTHAGSHVQLIQVSSIGPDTAIMLKAKIERGEFVVIVGDRTPMAGKGRVSMVRFMGQPAWFPQGPFILASLMRCPVYVLFCVKTRAGYRMFFETFAQRIKLPRKERAQVLKDVVARYAARLEYYAVRYPYQWYNFFNFWQ